MAGAIMSCMFLRSHSGKLDGLCLALHWSNIVHVMGSYVTELSVRTFVVQVPPFPFPLPDPTIKLLILVAAAHTPVVHNLCAKF